MRINEYIVLLSASMWAGVFVRLAEAGKQPARQEGFQHRAAAEDDPELVKYRQMFLERRNQHMPALQSLFESYDHDKQFKMVSMLLEKMEEMLIQSRTFLNGQQFQAGSTFPTEQTLRDTLSLILENVAFVGDIALRLPDITHSILRKKQEWNDILKWAFQFAQETGYYDDQHQKLLHLAAQELHFVERDPNFVNPYSSFDGIFEPPIKPKKKEKKQKKRGPRVSKSEL